MVTVESAVYRVSVGSVALMVPGMMRHGALSPVGPAVTEARVAKVAAAVAVAVAQALVFTPLGKVGRT